jgi:hypothetical protein
MQKENAGPERSVEDAQQAEDSPDTFFILTISLAALAVIGAVLLWYVGVFDNVASIFGRS